MGHRFRLLSPRSEFSVILVTFCLEDEFNNLIDNSILGATMLSITVKIEFWNRSSTVSTKLLICFQSFHKTSFQVFTFTVFSLVAKILLEVTAVKSRSLVPSLTITFLCLPLAALPIMTS